ncbi:hypothetical protein [Spiroplasma endosymbiont of Nebria brevicollis]|uniref:hypothetical protein n=1 Tax=Spiroplasma endosymbiont of Nebria brevicollis TaxID=3066284 RepID=UPI00313BA3B3
MFSFIGWISSSLPIIVISSFMIKFLFKEKEKCSFLNFSFMIWYLTMSDNTPMLAALFIHDAGLHEIFELENLYDKI